MELRELRGFCAVVETGSFSKAGKIVGLTQSTMTLQIQSLENNLNVCLFNRSKRERVLTEKGKIFYEYAKKIIALCDEATQSITEVDNLAKGTLRVGADTFIGEYILPAELASFKGIYPCVEISLTISDTCDIIEEIIKGGLEIGIVEAKVNRDELIFKDFIQEKFVLIVPYKHPFASQDKLTIEALKEEPFLLTNMGTKLILEGGLGLKKDDLNVVMSLGSTEAIKRGVIAGTGISIVPKIAIENELKLNLLKEVKIEGVDLFMDFYIVYNPKRFRSRIPELFVEHLDRKSVV